MLADKINCLIDRKEIGRADCKRLVSSLLTVADKMHLSDEEKRALIALKQKLDKNVNYVNGLSEFVRSWDIRHSMYESNSEIFGKSAQGNINKDGTGWCITAAVHVSSHPRFEELLEDGVKDLVMALIQQFDCITCSSCQGHASIEDTTPMRERTVEILPRHGVEYEELLSKLTALSDKANLESSSNAVRVMVLESIVESEDGCRPGLRIIFESLIQNEEQYFQDTGNLYDKYVDLILQCGRPKHSPAP